MRVKTLYIVLLLLVCTISNGKTRKTLLVIIDGVPADCIERLHPPTILGIAHEGGYQHGYAGGIVGTYSETPTISAVGYANILTGTWMNKHRVEGNENIHPNFNYPSIFRIAKSQAKPLRTAIYSSWTDNRSVLLGENKEENGYLTIDYVYDGYDLDTIAYLHDKHGKFLHKIDRQVCKDAAKCIQQNGPDINWLYLWSTDLDFHLNGYGTYTDSCIMNVDRNFKCVWEAVKKREKEYQEDWLVVVTTDHGRDNTGQKHGKQSVNERTVWISTNLKEFNQEFVSPHLSQVDIFPTICRFMNLSVPEEYALELDGISFYGNLSIRNLKVSQYDNNIILKWECLNPESQANIYVTPTNKFSIGGHDVWEKVATIPAKESSYAVSMDKFNQSQFFKLSVEAGGTYLNQWFIPREVVR